jgi:hypothetical protein
MQRPTPTILMDRNKNLNFPIFRRVNKEDEWEPDPESLLSIKEMARRGRTLGSSNRQTLSIGCAPAGRLPAVRDPSSNMLYIA